MKSYKALIAPYSPAINKYTAFSAASASPR